MKMENVCHYCGHQLTGKGLYLGHPSSGHGLYDGTPGSSGGSLKSVGKAVGKMFSKSAMKNTASELIHKGIPAVAGAMGGLAGEALGGPLGGVAGDLAASQAGEAAAHAIGNATGYGVKPRKPALFAEGGALFWGTPAHDSHHRTNHLIAHNKAVTTKKGYKQAKAEGKMEKYKNYKNSYKRQKSEADRLRDKKEFASEVLSKDPYPAPVKRGAYKGWKESDYKQTGHGHKISGQGVDDDASDSSSSDDDDDSVEGEGFRKGTKGHFEFRKKKYVKSIGTKHEEYQAKKYNEAQRAFERSITGKRRSRFAKGSAEAKEWGAKMKAAREAKKKGKSNEALKNRLMDFDLDPPSPQDYGLNPNVTVRKKRSRGGDIGSLPFS